MAGFSVNFDYKSNGADVAQMDASALSDLAEQLDKVATSSSSAESGMSQSLSQMAAQIREMSTQAADIPMALQGAVPGGGAVVDSSPIEKIGDDMEDMGKKSEIGSELAQSAMFNLGYASMDMSYGMSGPGGILESLGSFIGMLGMGLDATGAGIGIGVAAGLAGLAISGLGSIMSNATTQVTSLSGGTKDLVDDFTKANPAATDLGTALQGWAANWADFGISLPQLQKDLQGTGVSFSGVAQAMGGDNLKQLQTYKAQLDSIVSSEEAKQSADKATLASQTNYTNAMDEAQIAASQQKQAIQASVDADDKKVASSKGVQSALDGLISTNQKATDTEEAMALAMGDTKSQYEDYTKLATGAEAATQGFASSLSSVSDAKVTSSPFDLKTYLANMQAAEKANEDFKTNLVNAISSGLSAAGAEFMEDNAQETSQAWEAAKGNKADQDALIKVWNNAGSDSGDAYAAQLTSAADAALKAVQAKTELTIRMKADESELPRTLPPINQKVVYVPDTTNLPKVFDVPTQTVGKSKSG